MGTHLNDKQLSENQELRKEVDELRQAVHAVRESERCFREMIDALPTAIYTIDAQGRLTHFNPAAVEFAGRTPELGNDQWCVTWKLYYPDGRPMPHAECPMAIALKEGRAIRGAEAIAERPDGTRIWFMPYPTPLRDGNGRIVGGINMLVDITHQKQAEEALRKVHVDLQARAEELTRFNRAAVGREMRILELKKEVNSLRERLGESARYSLDYEPAVVETVLGARLPGEEGEGMVPLERILCTEELKRRPTRPPDYASETRALAALVQALADSPRTILQTLAEKVVEVLQADSAGLSLLTRDGKRFYWAAIAGAWAPHQGGGTPRDFGPCGDVLNCKAPLLFKHWERRYPYLSSATPLAEEGLLVPFCVGGKAVGTIWAIAHDASRCFDAEDLRMLESLGYFASAAYQAVEFLGAVDQSRASLSLMEDAMQARRAIAESEARLRLLWEAAALLLTANDPDAMLRELFAKIGPHLQLDVCLNYLVDESGEALGLASHQGISDATARSIARLIFGQALCGTVALERQPLHVIDIQQSDEPQAQLVKSLGIRAYTCNPLISGDRLLGTLAFGSRTRDRFNAEELAFLETLCHYVTVAYERLRLVNELKEADRRKDEFLATLAHELRNPLAPVRNAVQVLHLKGSNAPEARWARDVIERQVAHLTRLIDDLLDVSRISRSRLELRKERVELSEIVKGAVETSRPLIEQYGHELTVSLPAETLYLEADLVRLAQVFMNLLTNAAKYTERGGRIWLNAEQQGREVVVRVKDTGVGIPPEKLSRLFELFFQVEGSLERSQGGLGIGLSLVRRLVELHGGSVKAHSAGLGKGSEFTVRLPVLAEPPAIVQQQPERNGEKKGASSLRILVVDDVEDSAESMALLLRLKGHTVETAHDGLTAVEMADRLRPEIVMLDIGMPKLNGYDACRRIRAHPWGRQMLLIALTGWGAEEDKRRTEEAGFDGHLVKPVDASTLQSILTQACSRFSAQSNV